MKERKMFDEPELERVYTKALESGAFDALQKTRKVK